MKNRKIKILSKIKKIGDKIKNKGASYIFLSSIINKVFMFLTNILINRLMIETDYGIFTYAYNIVVIISIVSSLGIDSAMLQYCCENRPDDEKLSIIKFAVPFGILVNIIFSICTFLYATFLPLSVPGGKKILQFLSFILPFPCSLNFLKFILRSKKDNKKYSILTNIASFSYLLAAVSLIYPLGILGTVLGRYVGYIIPIFFGLLFLKNEIIPVLKAEKLNNNLAKEFIKYGIVIAITNGVSELLYYFDVYVVGLVTNDALNIASYKTATQIPNALAALPNIIMIFIYPYFVYHKDDSKWIKKNLKILQIAVFPCCLLISGFSILFAPSIIKMVYGSRYLSSVEPFRILMVSFIFSASFRVISGNILVMMRRINLNFFVGCIECVLNIVFDLVLVNRYGSIGAAIATAIITIISSILTTGILYYLLTKSKKPLIDKKIK